MKTVQQLTEEFKGNRDTFVELSEQLKRLLSQASRMSRDASQEKDFEKLLSEACEVEKKATSINARQSEITNEVIKLITASKQNAL
jgi:methylthioribose-1-phosphate isomerase